MRLRKHKIDDPGPSDPSVDVAADAADEGGAGVDEGSGPDAEAVAASVEPDAAASPEAQAGDGAVEATNPVEVLAARVDELEEKLARARAELQNAQRRHAVDRAQAIRYANADVIKSLLGVMDDLERSLAAAEGSNDMQAVVGGVRLVCENLTKALRDHGMVLIPALHEPFDPEVHQAIMQQPAADYPPGTVVQELAKGYRLHDRVLRPSKVIVSKAPGANSPGAATDAAAPTEVEEDGLEER